MIDVMVKIENKKYRIIPEDDYISLLNDLKDIKKVLKRQSEKATEAKIFFKEADKKMK